MLRNARDDVHDGPVHGRKIPGIDLKFEGNQLTVDPVEKEIEETLEHRFLALPAHATDDLVLFVLDFRKHRRQQIGRILTVGIHDRHDLPGGLLDAGVDGELVPEVARKTQAFDPRMTILELLDDFPGPVTAAIIDQNDLERASGRLQDLHRALDHVGKTLLFVVGRHHDAVLRIHGADDSGAGDWVQAVNARSSTAAVILTYPDDSANVRGAL